jgi:hypothetical protein
VGEPLLLRDSEFAVAAVQAICAPLAFWKGASSVEIDTDRVTGEIPAVTKAVPSGCLLSASFRHLNLVR